ncbi:MAG TPA: DUF1559 domain-containing protein, partial [Aestuariivirgaceae bacterium]|nr:DUF1559 domain-containing protein [Aestuariivirgaceae bacterium]
AIIGVLVALLLPAVQAARESARRSQCSNHLKQIGVAFHLHHDTYGAFPSGGNGNGTGWGGADPNRAWMPGPAPTPATGTPATVIDQSWNWTYQILPYIEQQALYQQLDDNLVKATPVKIYFCPSRRAPRVFDVNFPGLTVGVRAQLDYAGCRGGNNNDGIDGVLVRSRSTIQSVRAAVITDGTSNTLMVAERCQAIQWHYAPATVERDWHRGGWVTGFVGGSVTFANLRGINVPLKDLNATTTSTQVLISQSFGSNHPGGINALLSDGSVRTITYTVDRGVFLNVARRDDGNPVGDL